MSEILDILRDMQYLMLRLKDVGPPDYIVVQPWVIKTMKKCRKMFGRRDKRRKHKRYG